MLDKPGRIHFVDASLSPSGESMKVQLSGRVLLADDVAVTRKLVSVFLEKAEAKVETAENGRIALEKGKEAMSSGKPFDLILMDMQMPEMDGYTATTELRKAGFKGPVVALTASAMVSDREKCIRAGCDEFITKPVDRKKLLELADRFMKQGSAKVQPGGSGGGSSPAPEKDDGMEERLVSEMASDPEMAEIIQVFLEWLPGRIEVLEGMKKAASLGSKASGLAHEIKGTAGSCGFKPIQDAAEELEGRIRGKADPRAVAESLEKLIKISKRACLDPARAP
jgi:CheY-like chemotaxis protein